MQLGKLFQRSGAETAKALDPWDFRLKLTGFRHTMYNVHSVIIIFCVFTRVSIFEVFREMQKVATEKQLFE